MVIGRGQALLGVVAGLLLGTHGASAAEYIVKFKDPAAMVRASHFESFLGATVLDAHKVGGLLKVDLGEQESLQSEAEALSRLMHAPGVQYVVQNFKLNMLGTPDDPRFSEQWALTKIRAQEAWDINLGSRAVTVAVIDTGIDYTHPDLAANIYTNPGEIADNGIDDDGNGLIDDVHGWDFLDNDKDPMDATSSQNPGHGTHCAGIIGAVGNNGMGTSGINQQVSIMPLRFIGPTGQGDLMAAIKAIDYAIAIKADVISASWGAAVAATQAQPLIEAIGRADSAGLVFVAAAANDGKNNDDVSMYPANAPYNAVIAVAASDNNDGKPTWSNYGKGKVALASPGLDILSTLPANTYGNLSGTSMATPLVAGLVAMIKAQGRSLGKPEFFGAAVESILQATGTQVAIETACMCRVDAMAALTAVTQNKLVVIPTAATYDVNATGNLSAIGGSGGYHYTSNDPAIFEVNATGAFTAKALGETTVRVTDQNGSTGDSLTLRVIAGGGGGGGECPIADPLMCALLCLLDPTQAWCN